MKKVVFRHSRAKRGNPCPTPAPSWNWITSSYLLVMTERQPFGKEGFCWFHTLPKGVWNRFTYNGSTVSLCENYGFSGPRQKFLRLVDFLIIFSYNPTDLDYEDYFRLKYPHQRQFVEFSQ